MFDFFANASVLRSLYKAKAETQVRLAHAGEDLEGRKAALVPAGGWLSDQAKATVDQRKAAAEKAYADDQFCQELGVKMSKLRDDLADLEAQIDGFEEFRRAGEWTEKQRYNTVLERRLEMRPEPQASAAAPATPYYDDVDDTDEPAQPAAELEDDFPF